MAGTKEIRRRIKSIISTRQVTKAMELVSAAKMRKAQSQALATRAYASLAWELINNLARTTNPELHRLLKAGSTSNKTGMVLISSNRGLAGSFNHQIYEKAQSFIQQEQGAGITVELVTMGAKARDSMRKTGGFIAADFKKIDFKLEENDIKPMADLVISDFLAEKYDKIAVLYMEFVSTLKQIPRIKQLLPIARPQTTNAGAIEAVEYLFEPTAEKVLEEMLPRLIQMQLYQAVLETNASEHSARMVAMKNASDAADDLVTDLTLEYNQMRQANITKEISEIVSGRLALGE